MRIFKYLLVGAAAASLMMACDEGTTGVTPDGSVAETTIDNGGGGGDTTGAETTEDAQAETVEDVPGVEATTDTGLPDEGPETIVPDVTPDEGAPDVTPDEGTPDVTPDEGTPDVTPDEGTPDTSPDTGGTCPPTFGDEITRINSASMPSEASLFACDSNNDGGVDGDDGELNTFLTTGLVAGFVNVNEELTAAVTEGSLILLADFGGYAGTDATNITTNVLIGSDIETQPDPTCGIGSDIDGVCDWNVDPDSFTDTCDALVSVPGCTVTGGALECGPSDFQFTLPLGGLSLSLEITSGRLNGDIASGASLTDGQLCGSVAKQNLLDALDAACAGPDAPSFCSAIGLVGSLLDCGPDEECTIVLGLDGNATGTVALGQ